MTGIAGQIVSWEVPATVSLVTLRDALTAAGLDPSLASDMQLQHALRRAQRDMREGRVIRQLRREGDSIYFQFTAEHLTSTEATYDKEAHLSHNLITGDVN
jgi:hypothetical protein